MVGECTIYTEAGQHSFISLSGFYHIMKLIVFAILLGAVFATPTPRATPFKLCVPHGAYEACQKMVTQGASVGVTISCVVARDRLDCMSKVQHHEADFEAVDPEDMYLAAKMGNDDFSVFKEIRTKEEPEAEFRYEAIMLVRKDLNINKLSDLKGLKSCHTGVGRNVGYKIPITKLTKAKVLGPLNDITISPRENELKALSSFFTESCIVGKWSPDPETNQRLKQKYSKLCALCEFPDKCDYPDRNSGYDGALRCLAKGGGDVAFTKVIFVKKFFGMAYGTQPAAPSEYNPDDYVYFCEDGTKKPVTGPACSWAARPWQGYMANSQLNSETAALREQIAKLNNLGESTHADWITSVLALNNMTLAVDNKGPIKPKEYLEKAKYVDVIERDVLEPRRFVRFCVTSDIEKAKCEDLKHSAYSRDIRPGFECIQKSSKEECFAAIQKKEADIVSAHSGYVHNKFNLKPVVSEEYGNGEHSKHGVVVVKKTSSYQNLADLKGTKACLPDKKIIVAWNMVAYHMIKNNLIQKTNCPYTKAVSEFFSNVKESYNPFQCLSSGEGDVAVISYENAKPYFDNAANGVKLADYELICQNGGRQPMDNYASCNFGEIPPQVVLASSDLSTVERDDILFALLSAANLYTSHPDYFRMFGDYNGTPNVLFSNIASGLESVGTELPVFQEYNKVVEELKTCTPEHHQHA